MSDSRFIDAVGFFGLLDITDEGGWAFEVLPQEEVVVFGAGARAESEADLKPPEERERAEFQWADMGLLDAIVAEEEAAAESRARAAAEAQAEEEG
jgi:hypothetical protein